MASAIYCNPLRNSYEWHRRIVSSIGLDFIATGSIGETLEQMESRPVPLVLLSSNGGYPIEDAVFPIKARHGEAKIIVLSSSPAPDRIPSHIDAWICVAEHESILLSRLRRSIDQ